MPYASGSTTFASSTSRVSATLAPTSSPRRGPRRRRHAAYVPHRARFSNERSSFEARGVRGAQPPDQVMILWHIGLTTLIVWFVMRGNPRVDYRVVAVASLLPD